MELLRRMISIAKKLHMTIGTMNKKLFKYGCGKRVISRTNWDLNTFSLVEDINQSRQKTLCSKVNNIKRAYELQISEHIILAHMQTAILLHNKLQKFIKYSDKLDIFCKSLAFPNTVEFNENLLAMFKQTEIATAGAFRSLSEFRLDALKLTRDLLNWYTLIKPSK